MLNRNVRFDVMSLLEYTNKSYINDNIVAMLIVI